MSGDAPREVLQALRLRLARSTEIAAAQATAFIMTAGSWLRSVEFAVRDGEVSILVCPRPAQLDHVRGLVAASLRDVDIEVVDAHCIASPLIGWEAGTRMSNAIPLQARSSKDFDLAPALVELMSRADDGVEAVFQLIFAGAPSSDWHRHAQRDASRLIDHPPTLAQRALAAAVPLQSNGRAPQWARHVEEQAFEKATRLPVMQATIRFAVTAHRAEPARRLARQAWELVAGAFAAGVNDLRLAPVRDSAGLAERLAKRLLGHRIVLQEDELRGLWHLDLRSASSVEGIWQTSSAVRSPRGARTGDVRVGRDSRGSDVYVCEADRRQHALLCGATGTGKSTCMINLLLRDIERGDGALLVDPKGDAVQAVLSRYPAHRASDLVVLDPSREPMISFNPLVHADVDDIREAVRQLYADSWGVRISRLVHNSLVVLKATPGAGLSDLYQLLVDDKMRRRALARVEDPFCLTFWRSEFDELSPSERRQWVEPVLHRLQPFLGNRMVRRALSGAGSIDFRRAMDDGKVVLADLSQGRLGPENAFVLAHLLISSVKRAALSRIDTPEERRRDYYLYVDEAQAAAPAHFVKILSECRAVRLNAVLATQFLHQLPAEVVEALLGNVGAVIAFRLGESDARRLASRFGPEFSAADLLRLDNYRAAVRLVSNGAVLRPFTLFTDPLPSDLGPAWADRMRDASLRRYASMHDEPIERLGRVDPAPEPGPPEVEWQPA